MTTEELMHRRKKRRRKAKCRNVCTFRIPLLGVCLSKKRRCKRKGRR
jgi:hypothetical protein